MIYRFTSRIICAVLFVALVSLCSAQPYGLNVRPAVGSFLNNVMPETAPVVGTNWSVVPAFPNIVFTNLLGITAVPGTNLICAWEREGRVWTYVNDSNVTTKTLVLDLSNQCQGWDDSGLNNLVFHPGFVTNHFMYLCYTWVTPGTVVGSPTTRPVEMVVGKYHDRLSRFTLTNGVSSLASETVLVDQTGDSVWHNGGGMFFHPTNGFLYYTDGDDERQDKQIITNKLLAGVFRLDVDMRGGSISHAPPRQPTLGVTANYYIPNDNPFVGQPNVLEEFFGVGLRSPHRMTIDPPTGRIYIGDVGASAREEITRVEPGETGLNFQWNYVEGFLGTMPASYVGISKPPILDYTHSEGQAVIGGHVYRGSEFAAELGGRYIFGDNVKRTIWVMDETTTPATKLAIGTLPKGDGPNSGSDYTGLSSFGLDANKEIYMCQMSSIGGRIYKLARGGTPVASRPLPILLSQTGVFTNLATLAPAPGLLPYTVNSPLWSDAAVKTRWMALATNTFVTFATNGEWTFPNGTVFVKHFALGTNDTNPTQLKRLETRLLVIGTNGLVYGAGYRWRPDNSDADLVLTLTNENISITTATGTRTQTWSYPGRADCLTCHTIPSGGVLGVKTRQLNGDFNYSATGVTDNQLRTWNHISLFSSPINEAAITNFTKLVSVSDTSATLATRVRSYLDANCAHCHRPGGGVQANFDARFDTPLANQGIIYGAVQNSQGISNVLVVAPADLSHSLLYLRDNSVGTPLQMPPLAKNVIDTNYIAVLSAWISSLVPPTISPIDDVTLATNSSTGPIPFIVGDASVAAGSLVVSGTSSKTNLVPDANIVFGGSGSNRTVTVTPAAGQSGSATITVRVDNGITPAFETFVVFVPGQLVGWYKFETNAPATNGPVGTIAIQDGSPLTITHATGTAISKSFTVTAGAKVMVVILEERGARLSEPATLTWNGQTLNRTVQTAYNTGVNRSLAIYHLFNPNVGTANITGTMTGAASDTWLTAYSLTGVDTNIAPMTGSADTGTDATGVFSLTFNLTGVASNSWAAVAAQYANFPDSVTVTGTGGTSTMITDTNFNVTGVTAGYVANLSAGAVTLTTTWVRAGGGQKANFAALVFSPSGASQAVVPDSSGQNNHGTANGSFNYVAGKIDAGAMSFDGTSGYAQIPRAVSNDFTLAFWVKTTATGGSSQWYSGKGLLDGEMANAGFDFGTSLVGAKAAFGVGAPDTTIASTTSINDGSWHHVAATRDATSGEIKLYVDGALEKSQVTTVTGPLIPTNLRIGSIRTGVAAGFLGGSIDDTRIYNYVLPATQIATLAGIPSLTPVSLAVASSPGQLQFSWPADHTGWRLETQTNAPGAGLGTNWSNVAGAATTNQIIIFIGNTNGSVFFRLKYP